MLNKGGKANTAGDCGGAIAMNSNIRFAVVMVIAIASLSIGSAAVWLASVDHGRLIALQSGKTFSDPAAMPATDIAYARRLRGCNVYVCGQLADRYSLGKFVSEQGGQVETQLGVQTDFVLMPANLDTNRYARDLQEAKDLHIPLLDQSKLLRWAQLR
jgi:NAD-dependent DNA ligase